MYGGYEQPVMYNEENKEGWSEHLIWEQLPIRETWSKLAERGTLQGFSTWSFVGLGEQCGAHTIGFFFF